MMLLQGLAPLVMAVAVASNAAERRIVSQLRVAGATAHDRATGIRVRGPLAKLRLKRLLSNSSIRTEAPDRYYLDEVAYAGLRRTRRLLALMVLGLVVAGTLAALALGIVRL